MFRDSTNSTNNSNSSTSRGQTGSTSSSNNHQQENTKILLSTDLGARGLHFPNLHRVINYDFPLSGGDYLQRAGRTGRAGEKGLVISIYKKKDIPIIE